MSEFLKKFTRTKENFTCEVCGTRVKGDGYTNHCPNCLWSKHVDVNPGDRQNECHGLMQPTAFLPHENVIIHRCKECGEEKRVRTSKNDDMSELIELSTQPIRVSSKVG